MSWTVCQWQNSIDFTGKMKKKNMLVSKVYLWSDSRVFFLRIEKFTTDTFRIWKTSIINFFLTITCIFLFSLNKANAFYFEKNKIHLLYCCKFCRVCEIPSSSNCCLFLFYLRNTHKIFVVKVCLWVRRRTIYMNFM